MPVPAPPPAYCRVRPAAPEWPEFTADGPAPDLTAFQDFILNDLTTAPNVAGVKTNLAIRRAKLAPGVPIPG